MHYKTCVMLVYMDKKILTLCMVYDDKRILLGMKKRGFGMGRWNGFGGKVEQGESIEEAARRELKEEAGIVAHNIKKRGVLTLIGETEIPLKVRLFSVHSFTGEPVETEEVNPQWFSHADIPYEAMWPDDKYWLPKILAGKNVEGVFHFKDTDTILKMEVKEIRVCVKGSDMLKIFAIYKPKGLTSNAVLNRLRRAAHTKKIGHAGTLDPLAEGVLVVGVGREATKQLAKEVAKEKEYHASLTLGISSTTDDEEGEKTIHADYDIPTSKDIEKILDQFTGNILQTPPSYSAIKINGQEAYKRVRKGEKVLMKPREVMIKSIFLECYDWPHVTLKVVTGPGVYIRSLARDIGTVLGTGAYLSGLVRTRVGSWTSKNALSLAEAEAKCIE